MCVGITINSQIDDAFTTRCRRLVMKALYNVPRERNAFTARLDKLVMPADLTLANQSCMHCPLLSK